MSEGDVVAVSEENNASFLVDEQKAIRQKLIVWAKVLGHPFWPARYCEEDERESHARFQQRKSDILVRFFEAGDSGSYGWIIPSNVKPFEPENIDFYCKGKKSKSLQAAIQACLDFCNQTLEPIKDDGVCCVCLKDDAHGADILICDKCDSEYHMYCLNPPITTIPEGDWFCPTCSPVTVPTTSDSKSNKKRSVDELNSSKNSKIKSSDLPKKKVSKVAPSSSNSLKQVHVPVVDISEDKCGICQCEGELLVCEFPKCSKVYHSSCIWPKGDSNSKDDVPWYCPRHSCSLCEKLESGGPTASSLDTIHRKCKQCIFSCCVKHDSSSFFRSKAEKSQCMFCTSTTSPYMELAVVLHNAWSKMSSHYLSLPFMRPFLSMKSQVEEKSPRDLIGIVEKIRNFQYTQVSQFILDINTLRDKCVKLAPDFPVIQQAYDTLVLNGRHFLQQNKLKIDKIETKIKDYHTQALPSAEVISTGTLETKGTSVTATEGSSGEGETTARVDTSRDADMGDTVSTTGSQPLNTSLCQEVDGVVIGLHGHTSNETGDNDVTPLKTLTEWNTFILNPPIDDDEEGDSLPQHTVASILLDLCSNTDPIPPVNQAPQYETCDNQQGLLDSQSVLLRQLMTSHSLLQNQWRQSKEKLLTCPEAGEENAITLGESHVILELHLSNQGLKAQLEQCKADLNARNQALQACVLERNKLKLRNEELEEKLNKHRDHGP